MRGKFSETVKSGLKKLGSTVSYVGTDIISHWKKPAKGNYVSYGELTNYGVGGMGQQMVIYLLGCFALTAGNTLLGSTIGIRPLHLQYMYTIQTIINVFMYWIRGKLVDNTRTPYGRFRPYIAIMGIPLVVISICFMWLPFERMTYMMKLIATFCFAIGISILQPLFADTYTELGSCMTPNTKERTTLITVSSLIYSAAPTIYLFLVPILSDLVGGLTDIRTYRFIYVPIGVIGVGLSLFAAFGCKERVVTSKSYVQKVGVLEGVISVYKNKYWWIRNIATLVAFLEGAYLVLFSWIYIYGAQDMTTYAFLTTILGTASGISMICTPYLLAKLGNRKVLLMHNSLNIVFMLFMLVTYKAPGLYFVFLYINTLVNQLQIVYNPVLAAEVKDSIQYQSGKRVDFTLGAAGAINVPITVLSGLFIPFIYECMGLTVNYDVLYDPLVRNSLFYILCVISIIGAALNLIPFFFYNLSREKHQMIILALQLRAINDDYANNCVESRQIKNVVEKYNEAISYRDGEDRDVKALRKAYLRALFASAVTKEMKMSADWNDKDKRKAMKSEARKEKRKNVKALRKEYVSADKFMEFKNAYYSIMDKELHKYEEPCNKIRLIIAREIASLDINDLVSHKLGIGNIEWDRSEYSDKVNKKIERIIDKEIKTFMKMQDNISKYYPKGVEKDYHKELMDALDVACYTKEEKKNKNRLVKKCEREYHRFLRVFKCWDRNNRFLKEYENSFNFEKYILPRYEEANAEVMRLDEEEAERERIAKENKKREIEAIRQAKKEKKEAKKAAKKNKGSHEGKEDKQ